MFALILGPIYNLLFLKNFPKATQNNYINALWMIVLNEASRLPGLTVYTRKGMRLGVVHDVLLDTTQRIISALLITGTTPDLVKDGANVIIPYRWVQDLDDVVILRYFPDKIDFTENSEKTEFEFEDDDGFYDD